MRRSTWAKVTAGQVLAYGIFLVIQAFVPVWPTEEMHNTAMLAGGIYSILWAVFFWKTKR